MDSPSWLSEEASAPAATKPEASTTNTSSVTQAPPPPAPPANALETTSAAASNTNTNPDDVNRVIWLKRLWNMMAASACATRAILQILTPGGNVSELVISLYSAFLSAFVFLSEMTEMAFMKWILASHGYLYSPFWRFWFYLLLASMQLSDPGIFGYINAIAMATLAFVNAYWLIKYPALRSHSKAPDNKNGSTTNGGAAADTTPAV